MANASNFSLFSTSTTAFSNATKSQDTILTPIARFLTDYYQIFIIIIGLFGNTLTILLFSTTKLTHLRRTRFYLINMAFSDNSYLLIIFFQYLDSNNYLLTLSKYKFMCKFTVYMTYILNFLSCGLVMTFTVQRFCSICFPLSINMPKLEKRSKIFVVLLLIFASGFYSFSLFFFDLETESSNASNSSSDVPMNCKALPQYANTVEQLNFFDSLFTLVIPFVGLLVMVTLVAINLIKLKKFDDILNSLSLF
jgi:hypothetical protein